MIIKKEMWFEDFEPWCGAKFNYQLIDNMNKGSEFFEYLDETYPDGLYEMELNDMLWFDDEFICEFLNLNYEEYCNGKFVDNDTGEELNLPTGKEWYS